MIKKLNILLIFTLFSACADSKKNPLLIPPDYDKIVKEENNDDRQNSEVKDNKDIIELKKLLLKN